MKECTKCHKDLPDSSFNQASRNKNGLRAECRNCQHAKYREYTKGGKARIAQSRWTDTDKGRESSRRSDRKRNQSEHRREYKRKYVAQRRMMASAKAKDVARYTLNNAIKGGHLQRGTTCQYADTGACSGKLLAHHDDYTKPLDVRWLCSKHDYDTHHGLIAS